MSKNTISEKKYTNAILFLCKELGGSIVGKKKLYKLLYYIDFDNYEYKESMHSITGDKYLAWEMGPVPCDRGKIIDEMEKKGLIAREEVPVSDGIRNATKYTALKEPDLKVFSSDEIFIMDHVAKKYGRLTGKQLETLTHSEAPYIGTKPNDIIDYGLAFYRETTFDDNLATA